MCSIPADTRHEDQLHIPPKMIHIRPSLLVSFSSLLSGPHSNGLSHSKSPHPLPHLPLSPPLLPSFPFFVLFCIFHFHSVFSVHVSSPPFVSYPLFLLPPPLNFFLRPLLVSFPPVALFVSFTFVSFPLLLILHNLLSSFPLLFYFSSFSPFIVSLSHLLSFLVLSSLSSSCSLSPPPLHVSY